MNLSKSIICMFIISWGVLSNAYAQQICPLPQDIKPKGLSSLEFFKRITVLGDERILTVDSFARNTLARFSGRASLDGKPAVDWLARLLFAPDTTRKDKVFFIKNPGILEALKIAPEEKSLYSYAQIEPYLEKLTEIAKTSDEIEDNHRNIFGKEILALYQNIALYTDLANSFAFAIPGPDFQVNNDDVVRLLDLPHGKNLYSFFDIASKAEVIMSATANVAQKAVGEKTPQEEELLRLLGNLFRWSMYYENSAFRIIPAFGLRDSPLLGPWEAINADFKKEEIHEEINQLRNLVIHYWNGDQLQFDMAARLFQNSIMNRIDSSEVKNFRGLSFETEILNNRINPLLWAELFYGTALFTSGLFLLFKKVFFKNVAVFLMILAFLFNAWAVISFTMIMSRSPFENYHGLFSSTGLISILLGLVFIVWNKKSYGVALSSAWGFGFLVVASRFPVIF
ncbi:MAG: hypothetical protein HZA28_05965 [Candidatus Omnitrophica bacterium]|nr:hypothetical protein [Candidatus Omnitrophota bacterium]